MNPNSNPKPDVSPGPGKQVGRGLLRHQTALGLALVAVAVGCVSKDQSIVFATKTSWGVDVDSKPPAIDIAYSRKEGTLSPTFGNGQVIPQLASIQSDGSFAKTDIQQMFAVGNPAYLISRYLFTDDGPTNGHTISEAEAGLGKIPGAFPELFGF